MPIWYAYGLTNSKRSVVVFSDCGCDEECGLYNDCCFPGDSQSVKTMETRECISLGPRSYHIITSCPGLGGGSCWNFTTTTPWGNLNPYFSASENKIYLNRECAICNNVKSITDNYFFTPRIKCHFNREALFKTTHELVKAGECGVSFEPDYDIFPRLCDKQCDFIFVNSCNPKWYVEPRLNAHGLSYVRMKQLCLSNFSQPLCHTKSVYKNIYCYACQLFRPDKMDPLCDYRYNITERDILASFTIFLDSTELTRLSNGGMAQTGRLMACGHVSTNYTEVSVKHA